MLLSAASDKETHPVGSELAVAKAMAALLVSLFPLAPPDELRRGENKLLQVRMILGCVHFIHSIK